MHLNWSSESSQTGMKSLLFFVIAFPLNSLKFWNKFLVRVPILCTLLIHSHIPLRRHSLWPHRPWCRSTGFNSQQICVQGSCTLVLLQDHILSILNLPQCIREWDWSSSRYEFNVSSCHCSRIGTLWHWRLVLIFFYLSKYKREHYESTYFFTLAIVWNDQQV